MKEYECKTCGKQIKISPFGDKKDKLKSPHDNNGKSCPGKFVPLKRKFWTPPIDDDEDSEPEKIEEQYVYYEEEHEDDEEGDFDDDEYEVEESVRLGGGVKIAPRDMAKQVDNGAQDPWWADGAYEESLKEVIAENLKSLKQDPKKAEKKPQKARKGKKKNIPKRKSNKPYYPKEGADELLLAYARKLTKIKDKKQKREFEKRLISFQIVLAHALQVRAQNSPTTKKLAKIARQEHHKKRERVLDQQLRIVMSGGVADVLEDEEEMYGTVEEVIALADATTSTIKAALQGQPAGQEPWSFLTDSSWASGPGLITVLFSIGSLTCRWRDMDGEEKVDALLLLIPSGFQKGATMAMAISSVFKSDLAEKVVTGTGAVAGVFGVITSGISAGLEVKEAWGCQKVLDRFDANYRNRKDFRKLIDRALTKQQERKKKLKKTGKLGPPTMEWLLYKVVLKLKRRKYRAGTNAAFSLVSGTGSALGVAFTVGAAVGAAIPVVGWVFLGVALAGTLGTAAYKFGRYKHKVKKLQTFRDDNPDIWVPKWAKTNGEFNRFRIAIYLFISVTDKDLLTQEQRNLAECWIGILYGGSKKAAEDQVVQDGVAGIMAYIKG